MGKKLSKEGGQNTINQIGNNHSRGEGGEGGGEGENNKPTSEGIERNNIHFYLSLFLYHSCVLVS